MELTIPVGQDTVWTEHLAGDGVPIVLLHPGVGDSRVWDLVLPGLDGRRVLRYDVRGYGRSPLPTTEFSLLKDLETVLDQLELQQVLLVGCSMGGGNALSYALAHPERVHGLVLLCPGVPGFPWPDEPELDARYDVLAAEQDVDGLVKLGLREWARAGSDDAVVAQLRAAIPAWFDQDDYLQEDPAVYDRLHEIQAPSVVMVGDKDRPILAAVAGGTAARIPGCEFIWMPGVDHFPSLREPQLVTDTILRLAGD
ncbi:pimeloyl-ACP methyl ester carboxylesterase [Kribbella aluminosa]|uniref:Pimeloyl-ACP methyl ester carboxylesterase n=1 Tax=Kribbella aluminosa TaxID=416017 RepID=A0ABS4UQZ3_9ACTN|nr:alpha/beta hydrolase [Kribbella aluminosa]MBP2354061.1 pimeloyl-ACP methyl ester carboxylesterase [Kribbella aluminosa]